VSPLTGSAPATQAPRGACDHDGKASGRLVLEDGSVRLEIVCECGAMIASLGRQEYRSGEAAPRRRMSRRRWRRSRALLFSARRGHAATTLE
jgi:hypothetical protein